MRLTHDPRYNIAYMRIREETSEVETIRISDELNIDLTPDGKVWVVHHHIGRYQEHAKQPVDQKIPQLFYLKPLLRQVQVARRLVWNTGLQGSQQSRTPLLVSQEEGLATLSTVLCIP